MISTEVASRKSEWQQRPGGWLPFYHLYLSRWDYPAVEELLSAQIRAGTKPGPYQSPQVEYALLLLKHGFPGDALRYIDRFADLDSFLGKVLRRTAVQNMGLLEEALGMEGRAWVTADILMLLDRLDEAERALSNSSMDDTMVRLVKWQLLYKRGDYERAEQLFKNSLEQSPMLMGNLHHIKGEHEAGFAKWFEAARSGDPYSDRIYLGLPSVFRPSVLAEIHSDPRFEELAQAVGLGYEWRRELCKRASELTPVTGVSVTCVDDL